MVMMNTPETWIYIGIYYALLIGLYRFRLSLKVTDYMGDFNPHRHRQLDMVFVGFAALPMLYCMLCCSMDGMQLL